MCWAETPSSCPSSPRCDARRAQKRKQGTACGAERRIDLPAPKPAEGSVNGAVPASCAHEKAAYSALSGRLPATSTAPLWVPFFRSFLRPPRAHEKHKHASHVNRRTATAPPHRKNTDRGRRQQHDFPGIPRARKNTQELRPQPTLRQHKKTSPEDGTLPKTASSIPQRGAAEKRLPSSFTLKQTASCLRPFSSPKTPPAFRAGAPLRALPFRTMMASSWPGRRCAPSFASFAVHRKILTYYSISN